MKNQESYTLQNHGRLLKDYKKPRKLGSYLRNTAHN